MGTSFFSYSNSRFKVNSILTLINRAYNICSSFHLLHIEFDFLCNFFLKNGYPLHLIESKIRRFLSEKFNSNSPKSNQNNNEENFYFSLPYLGPYSEKISKDLNVLFRKVFPSIKPHFIFVNNFKILNFFRYKDPIPRCMRNSVVYKYCCPQCGSAYVGMTSRNFYIRVSEHQGRSVRTGRHLANPPHSAVRLHWESCGSSYSIEHFSVIDSASNQLDLKILESLYIYKQKPNLNCTSSSYPLVIVNS